MLRWAVEYGYDWGNACESAARGIVLPLTSFFFFSPPYLRYLITSSIGAHLQVLEWADKNGGVLSSSVCKGAAYGGHLDILQWAQSKGIIWVCTYFFFFKYSPSRQPRLSFLYHCHLSSYVISLGAQNMQNGSKGRSLTSTCMAIRKVRALTHSLTHPHPPPSTHSLTYFISAITT